jgi:hypothetical protein
VKPERRWICQVVVDLLAALAEFTDREAIRVRKRDVLDTQLGFLFRAQRSVALI